MRALEINVGQDKSIEDALEAIQAAVRRGDLFEVWVNEAPYFAAVCVDLGIERVRVSCSRFRFVRMIHMVRISNLGRLVQNV